MGRWAMPETGRLTAARDFEAVYARGRSVANRWIVLYSVKKTTSETRGQGAEVRAAVVVGRRFGTAVERNRLRRRIKEALRRSDREIVPSDVVLAPRAKAKDATFATVKSAVEDVLARAELIVAPAVGGGGGDGKRR